MSSVYPSVRLSVSLVDCHHIGWNSSEIISRLVSLGCSLSADPNISGLLQGGTPGNFSNGAIADPLRPPLPPKWGVPYAPKIREWPYPATGDPILHIWFRDFRVGGSNNAISGYNKSMLAADRHLG